MNTPLDGLTLPLEHDAEYAAAAEHYARHGKLPDNMGSPGAIDYINADPESFQAEVRLCQYANSMGALPQVDKTIWETIGANESTK